jgi:isocitrate lyase
MYSLRYAKAAASRYVSVSGWNVATMKSTESETQPCLSHMNTLQHTQ